MFELARNNTSYNEMGQAVIQKDNPWFYDDVWDQDYYKEYSSNDKPNESS